MVFQPTVNEELAIEGVVYQVAEHPHAPGLVYGQEGRQAVVYQLVAGEDQRALKVFKPRFQVPALVGLSRRLAPLAALPGLGVCGRLVLTPQQHDALLHEYPDLTYAVLMPWIPGPTWLEILVGGRAISPSASLDLARGLGFILTNLEQESLAHCDLSGPNLVLPALADSAPPPPHAPIELVDVEQLYGPDLRRPVFLTSGSAGYAHRTAADGVWSAEADRFAGAVLLAEMLGWCDERVRTAAWGESYFAPAEMQQPSERARLLSDVLRERWGDGVAALFERAWNSATLADCPTFGTWLVTMPKQVTPPVAAGSPQWAVVAEPDPVSPSPSLRTTPPSAPTLPRPIPVASPAQQAGAIPPPQPVAAGPAPLPPPVPAPTATTTLAELAELFDDGLAAYRAGHWARARELLSDVVREQPNYARGDQRASRLLADLERHRTAAARPTGGRGVWVAAAGVVLVLVVLGGLGLAQAQSNANATVTAIAAAQATTQTQHDATAPAIAQVQSDANATATARAQSNANATATAMAAAQAATQAQRDANTTATAEARSNANAAATAIAAAQATGTAQAVAALPVLAGTPVPELAGPITPANAGDVRELARWGNTLQSPAESVAFSPDGQTLASGSQDKTVRLWRVTDGSLLHSLVGHIDTVRSVAFSPDGQTLASASFDGTVRLWRVSDGSLIRTLTRDTARMTSVAFSPVGDTLASGPDGGTVRLWSGANGSLIRTLTGYMSSVWSVAFSPDGRTLATGSYFDAVRLWSVADGKPLQTHAGLASSVWSVAFSPDGHTLASGSQDRTVQLWRVSDGSLLRSLTGHSDSVNSVAFSPDGQMIASGSEDRTIHLWRVSDGSLLRTLTGHTDGVTSVVFAPAGQILASGSADGTVRLWGLP